MLKYDNGDDNGDDRDFYVYQLSWGSDDDDYNLHRNVWASVWRPVICRANLKILIQIFPSLSHNITTIAIKIGPEDPHDPENLCDPPHLTLVHHLLSPAAPSLSKHFPVETKTFPRVEQGLNKGWAKMRRFSGIKWIVKRGLSKQVSFKKVILRDYSICQNHLL